MFFQELHLLLQNRIGFRFNFVTGYLVTFGNRTASKPASLPVPLDFAEESHGSPVLSPYWNCYQQCKYRYREQTTSDFCWSHRYQIQVTTENSEGYIVGIPGRLRRTYAEAESTEGGIRRKQEHKPD